MIFFFFFHRCGLLCGHLCGCLLGFLHGRLCGFFFRGGVVIDVVIIIIICPSLDDLTSPKEQKKIVGIPLPNKDFLCFATWRKWSSTRSLTSKPLKGVFLV